MSTINKALRGIGTYLARRRELRMLSQLDDRTLDDINISRGLLEAGVAAYPWRMSEDVPFRLNTGEIQAAVRELQGYSDTELADLGISRGMIYDVVINGRPGIDTPANDTGLSKAA